MSSSESDPDALSPADAKPDAALPPVESLPEVQPPTTGFILQLFIIPALIVSVIVMIALLVNWVADSAGSPQDYLAEMRKGRSNSWQQALALAQALQSDPKYKKDAALAKQIAEYLDSVLDQELPPTAGDKQPDPKTSRNEEAELANLRQYLCMALGNFQIADDALPVLLKAAGMDDRSDDNRVKVRVAALMAIATLAENVKATSPLEHPSLMPTLLAVSESDTEALRSPAAVTLGVLGTERALERLEEMRIQSQPPNVDYNVATALARNGREESLELLVEMLQPSKIRGLPERPETDEEKENSPLGKLSDAQLAERRKLEQALIVRSAIQAVDLLADQVDVEKLQEVMALLEKLEQTDIPKSIQIEAQQLLRKLKAASEE